MSVRPALHKLSNAFGLHAFSTVLLDTLNWLKVSPLFLTKYNFIDATFKTNKNKGHGCFHMKGLWRADLAASSEGQESQQDGWGHAESFCTT